MWSKCFICYSFVYKKDFKSVVVIELYQYVVGDIIMMQLMKREKGVLVVLFKFKWMNVDYFIYLGDEQYSQYFKLLLVFKEQVLYWVVLEEKVVLEQQLVEEKYIFEFCFIEVVIQEFKIWEEVLLGLVGSRREVIGVVVVLE